MDGLIAAGFDVRLANTIALKQYKGLKYTDDKTDARYFDPIGLTSVELKEFENQVMQCLNTEITTN